MDGCSPTQVCRGRVAQSTWIWSNKRFVASLCSSWTSSTEQQSQVQHIQSSDIFCHMKQLSCDTSLRTLKEYLTLSLSFWLCFLIYLFAFVCARISFFFFRVIFNMTTALALTDISSIRKETRDQLWKGLNSMKPAAAAFPWGLLCPSAPHCCCHQWRGTKGSDNREII